MYLCLRTATAARGRAQGPLVSHCTCRRGEAAQFYMNLRIFVRTCQKATTNLHLTNRGLLHTGCIPGLASAPARLTATQRGARAGCLAGTTSALPAGSRLNGG